MPLYEYECEACGHRFERIQKFSDPHVDECPICGEKKVRKLVSSPAIQFKGSGFYINDYAKKDSAGTDTGKSEKSDAAAAKPASTETKDTKDTKATPSDKSSSSTSSGSSGSSDSVSSSSSTTKS